MTGRTSPLRIVGALAVAVTAAATVAAPIALAGAGYWDGPALDDLDLGAAGADAADGAWRVTELVDGDTPVRLVDAPPIAVRIDTVTAELRADAGCAPLLGSFTLEPSGVASFTVASPAGARCAADLAAIDSAVRTVLDGAERWQVTDSDRRLRVTGPSGHLVLEPTSLAGPT